MVHMENRKNSFPYEPFNIQEIYLDFYTHNKIYPRKLHRYSLFPAIFEKISNIASLAIKNIEASFIFLARLSRHLRKSRI